jgi:hypothetical protein
LQEVCGAVGTIDHQRSLTLSTLTSQANSIQFARFRRRRIERPDVKDFPAKPVGDFSRQAGGYVRIIYEGTLVVVGKAHQSSIVALPTMMFVEMDEVTPG